MKLTPDLILKKIRYRIFYMIDVFYDMKICKQNLCEYIPSIYRDDKNGIGSTGSQSTPYLILKRIFADIQINETDAFIDVGWGKGRVLAFCVKEKYPCSVNGIEINEIPGKIAKEWSEKYDNVHVMIGDAFDINYDQYTILFLGRPFLPKTFEKFIKMVESQITHPIQLIYWVDQQSGNYLRKRKGWILKKRQKIKKVLGINLVYGTQWFSIWEYTPQNNNDIV
jgi:SAM-dependent methyltransferase